VGSSCGLKSKEGILGCLEVVARIAWEALETIGRKVGRMGDDRMGPVKKNGILYSHSSVDMPRRDKQEALESRHKFELWST